MNKMGKNKPKNNSNLFINLNKVWIHLLWKKLECLKQAIEKLITIFYVTLLNTLAWNNKIGLDIDIFFYFLIKIERVGEKFDLEWFFDMIIK